MPLSNFTNPGVTTVIANMNNTSGDGVPDDDLSDENRSTIAKIVTYIGASIAIFGVCLTLLSYIGYRKFHIKRPHIVMVNLCFCLFLYYLSYVISNPDRQSRDKVVGYSCIFGAITSHFAMLAAYSWILVYWILLLVMYQRPVGGHISHFFIKASILAHGLPLIITVTCVVIAHANDDIREKKFYGPLCFVDNLYRYLGSLLPVALMILAMLCVFVVLMRGLICSKDEKLKTSTTRKNVRRHLFRLTIISLLLGTVASSVFAQSRDNPFPAMIVFGVVSSILGLALIVLFCLHHKEIREHWMSVLRGEDSTARKHSISRNSKYEVEEFPLNLRKASTLKGTPALYVDSYDAERKSSTCRIQPKNDTDMSTLGLIQIPGTPSPSRYSTSGKPSNEGTKVLRKKSDASSKPKHHGLNLKSPKQQKSGLEDVGEDATTSKGSKITRRPSAPVMMPKSKLDKRQQSSDAIIFSANSPKKAVEQAGKKRPSKGGNPANRLSRFSRKSTSILEEDTMQLTEEN